MEIKHEQIRDALRGWATEATQRTVAAEITRAYFKLKMQAPQLAQIERADGSVDDAAWHNNKQQIFRWLDSDSAGARQKIRNCSRRSCCAAGGAARPAGGGEQHRIPGNPRAEGTPRRSPPRCCTHHRQILKESATRQSAASTSCGELTAHCINRGMTNDH